MARLKIGNAIHFEIPLDQQVPAKMPEIGPGLIEQPKQEIKIEELLQQLLPLLPKIELPEQVDLSPIVNELNRQSIKLDNFIKQIEEDKKKIIIPEVKHITQIKDVSLEVLDLVEKNRKDLRIDILNNTNLFFKLEKQLNRQKRFNLLLSIGLLLTLFFHLI